MILPLPPLQLFSPTSSVAVQNNYKALLISGDQATRRINHFFSTITRPLRASKEFVIVAGSVSTGSGTVLKKRSGALVQDILQLSLIADLHPYHPGQPKGTPGQVSTQST